MPTPRVKFNWSILDRQSIIGFMMSLAPEIVGQHLTIAKFHSKVSNHLKKLAPVRTRKTYNVRSAKNVVWVGGTYYSDWDQDKKKCIEVVFEYTVFHDTICMSSHRFKGMCFTIADTILHELIHMRQFRRRKFKILPDYESEAKRTQLRLEQSYLGCSDEIDAYGFNIACELFDKFKYDEKAIFQYLNENQQGKRRRHNCWRMYLKAFQHDHNHPIIQRLKKKIVSYLPRAQIGKPYRNKDWISR